MVLFENIPVGNCRSETKSALVMSLLRSPILLVGASVRQQRSLPGGLVSPLVGNSDFADLTEEVAESEEVAHSVHDIAC